MKKTVALLLTLITLFPLTACSTGLEPVVQEEVTTEEEEKKVTETEEEEPLPTGDIVYPEGFSVGYNRQDVAPKVFPIQTYTYFNHIGYSNHDPIQLTCTAVCDGKTAFLLLSLDIRGVPTGFVDYSCKLIEEAVGIPKERVFLNATHTHSAPDNSHFGEGNLIHWQKLYYEKLVRAVTLALHDLTPAEAYVGTAHTEGVTFVRRYLMENGRYECNPGGGSSVVAHESQADTELRTIRFTRAGKKDVLLVNYQTHYHGTFDKQVSADFVYFIRKKVEEELDVHFSYHNGASGNLNFRSEIPGERKYHGITAASNAIADVAIAADAARQKVEVGSLQHEASYYQGKGSGGGPIEVRLYAFTIGDIGFCSAPYEMFDTNGMEIRAASPCKMTFVCAYTNGHMGYCPSALAFPNGAYEVEGTPFARGSGEEFANELVRLLKLCKERE